MNDIKKSLRYYWLFMLIAIVSEVIGVLAMKYSIKGAPQLGLGVMYIMLVISIFSALLFAEPLNLTKILGITAIVIGIVLLEAGTDEAQHAA